MILSNSSGLPRTQNMKSLTTKSLLGFVAKVAAFCLLLFLPAASAAFWQAWVFLVVFLVPQVLIGLYLLKKDPALLARRFKGGPRAERRPCQKILMAALGLCFIAIPLVAGLDHRFKWSHIPASLVIAADVGVLVGFWIQFCACRENTFASAVIEIGAQQKVISTGPYAAVRHPLYAGALLVNCCAPVALGSWWGLPFALAMVLVIGLRLLDEENLLCQSLPGYHEYCQKVRCRLIPRVW
jgi:protein-S-isoprenylcysteine O-methyltransferase Ste14